MDVATVPDNAYQLSVQLHCKDKDKEIFINDTSIFFVVVVFIVIFLENRWS